ncbi:MAG: hypothetical protein RSF84_09355, partial [Ruthenibacterium sp.]
MLKNTALRRNQLHLKFFSPIFSNILYFKHNPCILYVLLGLPQGIAYEEKKDNYDKIEAHHCIATYFGHDIQQRA